MGKEMNLFAFLRKLCLLNLNTNAYSYDLCGKLELLCPYVYTEV